MLLTQGNYSRGLLIDEQWMGGVSESPDKAGSFVAFVIDQASGDYLAYQTFDQLEAALESINRLPRQWTFDSIGACGGGNCGQGQCVAGKCGKNQRPDPEEIPV